MYYLLLVPQFTKRKKEEPVNWCQIQARTQFTLIPGLLHQAILKMASQEMLFP